MVGIPGRSKACLSCLRRRKACDLSRPICKQCQRLDLTCTWYKQHTIFVDVTTKTALNARKSHLSLPSSLPSSSYGTQKRHNSRQVPPISFANLPQCLASQNDYSSLFMNIYLPMGCHASLEIPSCSTASWIAATCAAARNCNGTHDMLKLAVIACSLCMVGSQQGDEKILGEGRLVYGRALLQLVKGLQNVDNANRLTLVRTARMLSLFEIFSGQDSQGYVAHGHAWSVHNNGERYLLLSGNADMYKSGDAHQIFADGRFHIAARNIFSRTSSVLDEWQWKTIPWLECSKTPKDLLLDLFIEIPRLFETFDKLRNGCLRAGTRDLMEYLVEKFCYLSVELRSWYLTTGSCIESRIMTAVAEEDKATSMEHLAGAQLLGLYWCCLLLSLELRQAASEFQEAWMLADVSTVEGAQTICRKILRVIAMFLSPHSGWFGTNLAAFPLFLIHDFIQRQYQVGFMKKEAQTLQQLLETAKGKVLAAWIHSVTWSRIAMPPSHHRFSHRE